MAEHASTNVLLDQRTFSNFRGGKYEAYLISGNVVMTVTPTDGNAPVVSGIFFGRGNPTLVNTSQSSAVFRGSDSYTEGFWSGGCPKVFAPRLCRIYGAAGYMIANAGGNGAAYATTSVTGGFAYTWGTFGPLGNNPETLPFTDAMQLAPGSPNRIAAAYTNYQSKTFNINITMRDSNSHRIALYWFDPNLASFDYYQQSITIRDLSTGTLLYTGNFGVYNSGQYLLWDIKGQVVITVTPAVARSPLVSGLFDADGVMPENFF